jgi:hypothetical protein
MSQLPFNPLQNGTLLAARDGAQMLFSFVGHPNKIFQNLSTLRLFSDERVWNDLKRDRSANPYQPHSNA